eukprot:2995287-Rhodomonas_salina.2
MLLKARPARTPIAACILTPKCHLPAITDSAREPINAPPSVAIPLGIARCCGMVSYATPLYLHEATRGTDTAWCQ